MRRFQICPAAPTLAALNQGVKAGYGRIGVVGTPCQAAAVAKMKTNPLGLVDFKDPVALTVGLFCTWALDTRQLISFLSSRLDVSRIRGMDIPPPPAEVLVVDLGDRKVEISLAEIRPLVPKTCLICPDMTSEWADLSVGVLEGAPGWNTLIVRTAKGGDLLESAAAAGYVELREMPPDKRSHLEWASGAKKRRGVARAEAEGLLNNNKTGQRSALRMPADLAEGIVNA